jgi:hypothetical protein
MPRAAVEIRETAVLDGPRRAVNISHFSARKERRKVRHRSQLSPMLQGKVTIVETSTFLIARMKQLDIEE